MTRTASDRHDRVRRLKNQIVYFFLCYDLHLMKKWSLVFKQHSEYRAWFAGSTMQCNTQKTHSELIFYSFFIPGQSI